MMIGGAMSAMAVAAYASDGVEINHLGVNNTLVRVLGDGRYLMLPVQENNDDARINVLVDGKIQETIYVRLAKSKTDYSVPFDLSPYKGGRVILDIVTPQGRGSVREAKDDACWNRFVLADTLSTADKEAKFRPSYHFAPFYGWMNDPNGMFYKDGTWNLYFQYNPYGSKWQNLTWGHATSKDLVNWTEHAPAIRPNGIGAAFSGSCVVDHNNTAGFGKDAVIALYTSAGTSQMQSLASSSDNGMSFDMYTGNPVLTLESEARDPNMFWNESTGEWNLVLAHAIAHEMLFFTSPDLRTWTLNSAFGKGLGAQNGVWECPDLFELPVEGTDEKKWVLICNINPGGPFGGSAVQYFTGDWDGHVFTADTLQDGTVATKWLDYGKDNYALVSWSGAPDGRRTAIGWMSNWQYAAEVPTMQYRSANTLPREIGLFRGEDGQVYASSVPSPELTAMRGRIVADCRRSGIGAKARSFKLPSDGVCEIMLEIDAQKARTVTLTLSNSVGDKVDMIYDPSSATLSFDRRKSGIVDFSEAFPAITVAPTFNSDRKISLRLFIDKSSIEVFGNDGRFVMTNLVFPRVPYSTLSIASGGGNTKVTNLRIFSIATK